MTDNEPMLFERFTVVGTSPGPRLLILAGVHGDEPEPMVAVKRLRRLLGRLSIRGEVTLVPTINRSAWRRKARTGEVTGFIPDPVKQSNNTSAAEGVTADSRGVIYGAEVGPRALKRYERP